MMFTSPSGFPFLFWLVAQDSDQHIPHSTIQHLEPFGITVRCSSFQPLESCPESGSSSVFFLFAFGFTGFGSRSEDSFAITRFRQATNIASYQGSRSSMDCDTRAEDVDGNIKFDDIRFGLASDNAQKKQKNRRGCYNLLQLPFCELYSINPPGFHPPGLPMLFCHCTPVPCILYALYVISPN
ncbi:hypothetical protein BD289DRAFT_272347 [Coniella lustricola]|uniref:Uncharacterized protein n=1 Tax=Coniella lustricola TaxID=2025994 RepID=A0A2T3AKK7_9PEZI|nr:hypothetical protein BD289DRAFT_272347 [Coniella lustricola]